MKAFQDLINKLVGKKSSYLLGRWKIDYCIKKINRKIDLANEDNCGPCGQYINKPEILISKTTKNK